MSILASDCVEAQSPSDDSLVEAVDRRLDQAFNATIARNYELGYKLVTELREKLSSSAASPSAGTQLAEAEMLAAVIELESSGVNPLALGRAYLLFDKASQRFQQFWRPENLSSPPRLDDLMTLKRTLDRLQRAPNERLGNLPSPVLRYLVFASSDAGYLFRNRHFQEARECYELSLRLWDVAHGPTSRADRTKAGTHSALSIVLNRAGLHQKALEHAQTAVRYADQLSETQRRPPDIAAWRINLGAVYEALGDLATARSEYELAIETVNATGAMPSQDREAAEMLAAGLEHLAAVESRAGQAEKAIELSLEVLNIMTRLGSDDEDLARTYHNIAGHYADAGRIDDAEHWFSRALSAKRRVYAGDKFPSGHVSLARSLHLYAEFSLLYGDLSKAESIARESLAMREANYPPDAFPSGHAELADAWALRGRIQLELGQIPAARRSLSQAAGIAERLAADFIAGATLDDALKFIMLVSEIRDALLTLPAEAGDENSDVYRQVWAGKGMTSRIIRQRNLLWTRSGDPGVDTVRRQLEDVSHRLAAVAEDFNGPATTQVEALRQLRDEQRRLTFGLYEELGVAQRTDEPQFTELLAQLSVDTAFVDIVRSSPVRRRRSTSPGRYWAFVLRRSSHVPIRVDLGEAEELDRLILDFHRAVATRAPIATVASTAVGQQVWSRLEPALSYPHRIRRVLIAADGAFERMPWDALPSVSRKRFLIEDYDIARAIHGVLLTEQLGTMAVAASAGSFRATVVGDVDFGLPADRAVASFLELPDTSDELRQVSALLTSEGLGHVTRLAGPEARLNAVVAQLKQSHIVHIASHLIADRREGPTVVPSRLAHPFLSLEMSGIALADANVHSQNVLRGSRISLLSLPNLWLVNLAGCHGGLGDIVSGESSVASLEHAFQLAGARVTIASQWEADSTVAAFLMTEFYRELLKSPGADALHALRQAKLAVLRHGPASHADHPFYWANWHATGSPTASIIRPAIAVLADGGRAAESIGEMPREGPSGSSPAAQRSQSTTHVPVRRRLLIPIGLTVAAASCLLAAFWPASGHARHRPTGFRVPSRV